MSDEKEVIAYNYGPYIFGVTKGGRISGLCGESFQNENALLQSYDSAMSDSPRNPKLIRFYNDGTEVQLRPKEV